MTYLESITYLTGRFVQISQYLLKTSFRLVSFMEEEKNRLKNYFKRVTENINDYNRKARISALTRQNNL